MKAKFILTMMALCCMGLQLLAQTTPQIVGTWEMIKQTGSYFDGSPLKTDVSKMKQYKTITPTHWMNVAKDMSSDTITYGANFGEYTLTGDRYVEKLQGATTNYQVKVEGDKFYMEGSMILTDGRKAFFNEVYQKVPGVVNTNKAFIGTWESVSSYRMEGTNKIVGAGDSKQFQIITPTHIVRIEAKGGKLGDIMLGSYTATNKKVVPKVILSSSSEPNAKIEITTQLQGDKLTQTSITMAPDGTKQEWGATYQKVNPESAKVAPTTK